MKIYIPFLLSVILLFANQLKGSESATAGNLKINNDWDAGLIISEATDGKFTKETGTFNYSDGFQNDDLDFNFLLIDLNDDNFPELIQTNCCSQQIFGLMLGETILHIKDASGKWKEANSWSGGSYTVSAEETRNKGYRDILFTGGFIGANEMPPAIWRWSGREYELLENLSSTNSDSHKKIEDITDENTEFTTTETVELYDFMQSFLPDDNNKSRYGDWSTGDNFPQVKWKERFQYGEGEYDKCGYIDITIGGKAFVIPAKNHYFKWGICLSGDNGGYNSFEIFSAEESQDYEIVLEYLFPNREYQSAVYKRCEGLQGFVIYEIKFPGKRKIWLRCEIELGVTMRITGYLTEDVIGNGAQCYE